MEQAQGQEPIQPGQEPAGAQNQQPAPAPQQGQEPERFDADYVKSLRTSEADTRRKLRDAEAKLKEQDDAKLSEHERLTKKVAELEQQKTQIERERQERIVRSEVRLAAQKLGFHDPKDAERQIDLADVETDASGEPRNVDKLVSDLLKVKPYLAKDADELRPGAVPASPRAQSQTAAAQVEAELAKLRATGRYSL